ncbi:acyltransferase family protein [Clostridium sp. HCP1S3_B4]|uniref:acyltransferase family protein n=1 Tax=unclassified Clostridium TaxID=2614128 RepID=UPI003F8A5338
MNNKNIERNSAIELLRIITMIGVIILHYNNSEIGGGFKYVINGSVNQYYLYFTENLFICAVNLFIMISAYFLSFTQKRKLIKVIELIIQVIAFNLFFYIKDIVIDGNTFVLKSFLRQLLPVNYFVILYSVLYIISPYINELVQKLNKEKFKKLIVLLFLLFSFWTILVDLLENICGGTIEGLSTVGMFGSQYGYCIVNFVLIYFLGAYIRLNNIFISRIKAGVGIVMCFVLLYLLSITEHRLGFEKTITWNYNNPLVIFMAMFVMLFFINIKFKNMIVNKLAMASFTCYLFHGIFMKHILIEDFINGRLFILILHQLGSAIIIYLVSYFVYKIYYLCSHWFINFITPFVDKISIY